MHGFSHCVEIENGRESYRVNEWHFIVGISGCDRPWRWLVIYHANFFSNYKRELREIGDYDVCTRGKERERERKKELSYRGVEHGHWAIQWLKRREQSENRVFVFSNLHKKPFYSGNSAPCYEAIGGVQWISSQSGNNLFEYRRSLKGETDMQ